MPKKKAVTYYKCLDVDGSARFSGALWSLPTFDIPGMWHTVLGRLKPCVQGLHVVKTPQQIRSWFRPGQRLFTVEVYGRIFRDGNKYVCRTARLLREVRPGSGEWKKATRGTPLENLVA